MIVGMQKLETGILLLFRVVSCCRSEKRVDDGELIFWVGVTYSCFSFFLLIASSYLVEIRALDEFEILAGVFGVVRSTSPQKNPFSGTGMPRTPL